ncbi:MAG: hypothetical protein R6V85_15970 [Polyangia bacterium]
MSCSGREIRWGVASVLLAVALPVSADETGLSALGLPPPARGGDFEVEVDPPRILLGETSEARVSTELPDGARRVELFAAYGSMRDIEEESPGRFAARYLPPEDCRPRIDVVAVRVEMETGTRWAFHALQLVGQGRAEIRTNPRAEAVIRIGEREFGPVRADARGRASVRVSVPPGTRHGVDGEQRQVDLHTPRTSRIALFSPVEEVGVPGEKAIELFGVVVAEDGAVSPESVELEADRGRVEALEMLGDGAFRASYLPPRRGSGVARIEARPRGVSDPRPGTLDLVLVPAAEARGSEAASEESSDRPELQSPLLSAALEVGFVSNLGAIHSAGLFAEAAARLPFLQGRARLGARLGFTRSRDEGGVSGGALGGARLETETWIAPLTALVRTRLPLARRLVLALSGEIGAAVVDNRISAAGARVFSGADRERAYRPALGAAVALDWLVWEGAVLCEVRYLWIPGDLETLRGTPSAFSLLVGYRFLLL